MLQNKISLLKFWFVLLIPILIGTCKVSAFKVAIEDTLIYFKLVPVRSNKFPYLLLNILWILSLALVALIGFYVHFISDLLISHSFLFLFLQSWLCFPLIVLNWVRKQRKGGTSWVVFLVLTILTMPMTNIYIIVDSNHYALALALGVQLFSTWFLSQQYHNGSQWFLPNKRRKFNRKYIRFVHKDYMLRERLNKEVDSWGYCTNPISEPIGLYIDLKNIKMSIETEQVFKIVEDIEGSYIKLDWKECYNVYHPRWFFYFKHGRRLWDCTTKLSDIVFNFDD